MQKLEGDILKVKDLPIDVESKARTDVPDEPTETEDDNEDYEMEEEDDEGSPVLFEAGERQISPALKNNNKTIRRRL